MSRALYALLFAAVGTTFGAGDGSTTFNLPDMRGRVPIGAGQGAGLTNRVIAATPGAETHQLATSEIPAHTHAIPSGNVAGSLANSVSRPLSLSGGNVTSASEGGGGAHNNMQPSLVLNFIIKI